MSNKNRSRHSTSSTNKNKTKNTKSTGTNTNLTWILVGLGLVVILAVSGWYISNQRQNPSGSTAAARLPAEVSIQDAAEMRDAGAFILDVRQPEEWEEYHIPGSTLIPLGELQNRLDEVPKDKEIVVVCRSGNRSQEGRDTLLSNGFEQVSSMAGGVSQWRASGYETVSGP